MRAPWLLKPSPRSILITIIMTLLISSCSTEDSTAAAEGNTDTNSITNSNNTGETRANQTAQISGVDTGKVTEDFDSNGDGLLGASGKLNISDRDFGEAAFIAETVNTQYGSITIDAVGNWFYGAINSLASIQTLTSSDTLIDKPAIRSIDGTTHIVEITIYGVNETINPGATGNSSTGNGTTGNSSADTIVTNSAAIISGTDTGSVTEDVDPDGNNLLEVSGKLTITDINSGEAAFIAKTIISSYGNLTISSAGNWNYSADNSQSVIQNLNDTDTLSERLTVNSIDGTSHTIVITIIGANETISTTADISLSWTAPIEREDNKPIALSEIAGYKIYYGTTQGSYNNSININDGSATGYTFTSFPAGTYYFVITTRDVDGRESQYSTEVTIII